MQTFEVRKSIRFQHCDPGGIVFTPQYFNLFTEVVEDWFGHALNFSFSEMVMKDRSGIPAMKIVAKFFKPSLLGEELLFTLRVKRLRQTTVLVNIAASVDNERRCMADFLFGFATAATFSLTEWPSPVLEKIRAFVIE